MRPSLYLRDIRQGVNSCSEMPLDSSLEWRTINFSSDWFLPTAGKKFPRVFLLLSRMSVNTYPWLLLWGRTQLGKLEPASELFMGKVDWRAGQHRGRVWSMTLSHLPDWKARGLDVKLGTIFPPSSPSLLDLFTHELSLKGRRICCLKWAESLTSSFYTNLNPVIFQYRLCELLTMTFSSLWS